MDVITENYEMVSTRMRDGKGMSIKTHPNSAFAQLVVINMVDRTEEAVIGTFPTVEIAEKAVDLIRKAIETDSVPWDVNEFKMAINK